MTCNRPTGDADLAWHFALRDALTAETGVVHVVLRGPDPGRYEVGGGLPYVCRIDVASAYEQIGGIRASAADAPAV